MLIIKHRINSIKKLKNTNNNFGIEFDVRSHNRKIIINHEPFEKSILLNNYLKFFKHKFAVINIKEEGIEKSVIEILNKNKIKKYFLLDVTIPQMHKIIKTKSCYNFAIRISKYESHSKIKNFNSKIKWIWLDTFDGHLPISINNIKLLKKRFKICLVSPELTTRSSNILNNFKKFLGQNYLIFDAVCTKKPTSWINNK